MALGVVEPLEDRRLFAAVLGAGKGLVGDYFSDPNLSNLALARTDAAVDFAWPGSPAAGLPADRFSARWTGQVLAPYTQTYTFYVRAAGGVRLWVNNKLVVDNWSAHPLAENGGTVSLAAGRYSDVRLEYWENGTGSVRLSWSGPSTPKQVVPTRQLYRLGTDAVADGWLEGNVGAAGGAVRSAGAAGATAYTVQSAGAAGTAGGVHFLYKTLRDDGAVVARADGTAGAGVLVRADLAAGSPFVSLDFAPAGGVVLESRRVAGAAVRSSPPLARSGPGWLKLERDGSEFAGYVSPTGADGTWALVGTAGVPGMGTFAQFGMSVEAAGGRSNAATFTDVSVRPVLPLGGNVPALSDRLQDRPFVDLVKTTRGFYNLAGRLAPNGHADFAATDADGWPTEDFSFDVVDNTEWGTPVEAGLYRMAFRGPAGVAVDASAASPGVSVRRVSYDPATGVQAYDVVVPAGLLKLGFRFTNTAGQVRNLRVLQPGYGLDNTPTFTAAYLDFMRRLSPTVLRFLDAAKTNNNAVSTWEERTTPSSATPARVFVPGDVPFVPNVSCPGDDQPIKGIAWEHAIELCNTLGTDIWVNVPAHATDDYVRRLAALLRDTLRPDLNVYVEYSNEVWNGYFEQARYNMTAAVREVIADKAAGRPSQLNYDNRAVDPTRPDQTNPNAGAWGDRRYARRTWQVAETFRQAWVAAGQEDPINTRVRVVLSGQLANPSRFDNELAFLAKFYGPPKNDLYALGVAPYFGLNKYQSAAGATKDQLLEGMGLSIGHYETSTVIDAAFAKAKSSGLKLVAYEGGSDVQNAAPSAAAKRAALLDPRMRGLVARFLTAWYSKGGGLFNWFQLGANSYNAPCGTWPLAENRERRDEPRVLGYQQVRDAGPVPTAAWGAYA